MAYKQSLEYRGRVTTEGAAAYLESIARGLREGHITIESEGELIESAVGEEVTLELEAELSKKGRFVVALELDWRLRRKDSEPPPMLISSHPAPQQQPSDTPTDDGHVNLEGGFTEDTPYPDQSSQ